MEDGVLCDSVVADSGVDGTTCGGDDRGNWRADNEHQEFWMA